MQLAIEYNMKYFKRKIKCAVNFIYQKDMIFKALWSLTVKIENILGVNLFPWILYSRLFEVFLTSILIKWDKVKLEFIMYPILPEFYETFELFISFWFEIYDKWREIGQGWIVK